MVNRVDEAKIVDFLEAVYALERADSEWLTRSLFALSGLFGGEHSYFGFLYDASDEDLRLWNMCRLQTLPPELEAVWDVFESIASPSFVRSTFRSLLLGSARRTAFRYLEPVLLERERVGYGDFFFLNGLDPSGTGCVLAVGSRQHEIVPQPRQVALLRRMVAHLSAAYRCRRRLASAGGLEPARAARSAAEAIVDASGRVVHAEGAAQGKVARERLRTAAVAIESGRTRAGRQRGIEAIAGWHPIVAARWTLVDAFEEGGRRYVVARENQADAPGLALFTDRERQVVVHAVFGLTNKEIAYTLGISQTTVRVLTARAASRLRVRSRRELLAHPALRALRPDAEPSETDGSRGLRVDDRTSS